ncbi:hypothetical protein C8R43DRAFT_1242460 [Mycena crocata]|nr:hypothetical protein C8R43DRAFT_1242460 [Mycena crocata]
MSSANENTKLLSPSPPPVVNQGTRPMASTSTSGTTAWGTLRTVVQLVHGVGETFRGTVLGAIDDLENNGERKHHEIARRGQAEMDEAYRQLWGTTAGSSSSAQVEPTAYTTGYDAAPPTYNSTGTETGGFRPDTKNSNGN